MAPNASQTAEVASAVSAAVAQGVTASNGAPPVLKASVAASTPAPSGLDTEQLVQLITAQVIRELQK
jgi:hypothetical protein